MPLPYVSLLPLITTKKNPNKGPLDFTILNSLSKVFKNNVSDHCGNDGNCKIGDGWNVLNGES